MAKRFIDTGLFDDDWFMELTKDAKILWIYFLTKCDHAGMLKLNVKLCELQTGIKDLNGVIKQLGNRIVTVSERLYFIPKFLQYQYPGFPYSKAKAQLSAIEILTKYGIFKNGELTVSELLLNSYSNNNSYGKEEKDIKGKPNILFSQFWDLYDKKVGDKSKCEKKWHSLSDAERQKIIDTVPAFKKSIKDIQYLPYPETYLNQKRWNDILPVRQQKDEMVY